MPLVRLRGDTAILTLPQRADKERVRHVALRRGEREEARSWFGVRVALGSAPAQDARSIASSVARSISRRHRHARHRADDDPVGGEAELGEHGLRDRWTHAHEHNPRTVSDRLVVRRDVDGGKAVGEAGRDFGVAGESRTFGASSTSSDNPVTIAAPMAPTPSTR